jgi:hypothetical protein
MTGFYQRGQMLQPYHQGHPGTSLEARVLELELHAYYAQKEREQLVEQISLLHREIDEIERDRAAMVKKIGWWLITTLASALLAVLWSLVLPALRGGSPPPT